MIAKAIVRDPMSFFILKQLISFDLHQNKEKNLVHLKISFCSLALKRFTTAPSFTLLSEQAMAKKFYLRTGVRYFQTCPK